MRPSSSILSAALALQGAASVSGTVHHGYDYGNARRLSSFKWERPFPFDNTPPLNMEAKCEAEKKFKAQQWKLKDLQAPSPWSPAIETFLGWHPYPGTWEGIDPDGDDREFLIMEYTDVPTPVRDWIENQRHNKDNLNSKWWLFGVFEKPGKVAPSAVGQETPPEKDEDKVVLFAPAAMYEILPLWVGKGSECEGEFQLRAACWREQPVYSQANSVGLTPQPRCSISPSTAHMRKTNRLSRGPSTTRSPTQNMGRRI